MGRVSRNLTLASFALTSLLLWGCGGGGMSGKYSNQAMQLEFKGSKAYITMRTTGTTTEAGYEVDGDKVTIHNQAGNLVLTRNTDGTLSGAPGQQLFGPLKKE